MIYQHILMTRAFLISGGPIFGIYHTGHCYSAIVLAVTDFEDILVTRMWLEIPMRDVWI